MSWTEITGLIVELRVNIWSKWNQYQTFWIFMLSLIWSGFFLKILCNFLTVYVSKIDLDLTFFLLWLTIITHSLEIIRPCFKKDWFCGAFIVQMLLIAVFVNSLTKSLSEKSLWFSVRFYFTNVNCILNYLSGVLTKYWGTTP